MNYDNPKTATTLNKSNPKVSIYMIMRIEPTEDDAPDALLNNIVNACMGKTQPVASVPEQKAKELPQQPPVMSKGSEQRYGDKNKKMVTQKQVDLLNKLANERHFSLDDVCAHYGVSNVNQLNQKQMQEVFDKYKRV